MKTLFSILILFFGTQNLFSEQFLYLSNKNKKAIERYSINPKNGDLKLLDSMDLKADPGPLTVSDDNSFLLVSTGTNKKAAPQLLTIAIKEKGEMTLKATKDIPLSGKGDISKGGKYFVQYHYRPNKLSVLELKRYIYTDKLADSVTTTKNPHDVLFCKDKKLVFVPHNWENKMYQFSFNNESGKLIPLDPPFLIGPDIEKKGYANFRSMVLHPKLKVIYCTYEKGGGLASLKYGNKGLKAWQEFSSTRKGESAAASRVTISPNSRFLFMSNRKKGLTSTLAVFELNLETGEIIKRVGVYDNAASMSREVEVDTSGKFLYSSSKVKDSTVLHHINEDGSLTQYKEFKIGGGPMLILEK